MVYYSVRVHDVSLEEIADYCATIGEVVEVVDGCKHERCVIMTTTNPFDWPALRKRFAGKYCQVANDGNTKADYDMLKQRTAQLMARLHLAQMEQ